MGPGNLERALAIKGVLHPDDACTAVNLGADAVCVSNHGRQLDGAVASLDARAELVGRPYAMALGAGGETGVARVLEIFRSELDRTLALIGVPDVTDLDRSVLVRLGGDLTVP